ncbi:MAG: DNA repair protein RadA [Oscillospiraceae bacterium]|jgi:DNA repair protein RadA/Sms|nr:DNA repair protein RadA [Oscillospiraceae bacterium]
MSGKIKTVFICNECGYENPKWHGKCPSCGQWDSMTEEVRTFKNSSSKSNSAYIPASAKNLYTIKSDEEQRYKTGMSEFDRVLGGGLVKGSLVLLSGDPGIGKSTILLQICDKIGGDEQILYVSGEESASQIKLRADRLHVTTSNLFIMCETEVFGIVDYIKTQKPDIVIIDSIQTMNITELSSSSGSITQVRESTNLFMRTAKELSIPIIIVGHVNKDGNIAGPKVLEHIVDAVLYFEGERHLSYRLLRAIKNRYGSTNEIGVFEMLDSGLEQVTNPSLTLISGRPKNTPGTCVACVMEGSRPILAEVQGLVTPTGFGNPRRMATGFDYNRMSMLIAVLEKRDGYFFGNMDTYVNVVGGLRLNEPASDLSVTLALISSFKDVSILDDVLAFGEIGLTGEVRAVNSCEQRIKEAARLGFKKCVIPKDNFKSISTAVKKEIEIISVKNIREAFESVI